MSSRFQLAQIDTEYTQVVGSNTNELALILDEGFLVGIREPRATVHLREAETGFGGRLDPRPLSGCGPAPNSLWTSWRPRAKIIPPAYHPARLSIPLRCKSVVFLKLRKK